MSVSGGEYFGGVHQQVGEHLLQALGVDHGEGVAPMGRVAGDGLAPLSMPRRTVATAGVERSRSGPTGSLRSSSLSSGDAGDVEQVVEQSVSCCDCLLIIAEGPVARVAPGAVPGAGAAAVDDRRGGCAARGPGTAMNSSLRFYRLLGRFMAGSSSLRRPHLAGDLAGRADGGRDAGARGPAAAPRPHPGPDLGGAGAGSRRAELRARGAPGDGPSSPVSSKATPEAGCPPRSVRQSRRGRPSSSRPGTRAAMPGLAKRQT